MMMAQILPELDRSPSSTGHYTHGLFKKHKVLPHPRHDRLPLDGFRSVPRTSGFVIDTSASSGALDSQTSSPKSPKHHLHRLASAGPDLPPTPPTHSRTSSGSHTAQPFSPPPPDAAAARTPQAPGKRPPVTPPDQRSPPTPDETPPQPFRSHGRASRLSTEDRGVPRNVTAATDSRSGSFRTAREEPISSGDEAGASVGKATAGLSDSSPTYQPQASNFALSRSEQDPDERQKTRTRTQSGSSPFDEDAGSPARAERWDEISQRRVSVGRRVQEPVTPTRSELHGIKTVTLEDRPGGSRPRQDKLIAQSNASHIAPQRKLSQSMTANASPAKQASRDASLQPKSMAHRTVNPITPQPLGPRSPSGPSTQSSSPSTVIGSIRLINDNGLPRRQMTLRHVRKRRELREQGSNGPAEVDKEDRDSQSSRAARPVLSDGYTRRHDGDDSTPNVISLADGRARRELRKAGGIPVVVVPERQSSQKSRTEEPASRSASSRHSRKRRSIELPSPIQSPHRSEELTLDGDYHSDRCRSETVSRGSDDRTIDYAPAIPTRSSSLSFPTSHSTSRTGSLTAESIKALNDMHRQNGKSLSRDAALPGVVSLAPPAPIVEGTRNATTTTTATATAPVATIPAPPIPASPIISVQTPQTPRSERYEFSGLDHHDDAASTRKYSSRATPFSVMSMETNWTIPEVSEAQAVHMYVHQNSSVIVVDHSTKSFESHGTGYRDATVRSGSNEIPEITATSPEGRLKTPEQQRALEEIDSPLRNPRSPPDPPSGPPAINFIPATPSGLTPAEEKAVQLGSSHEAAAEQPAARRPSIVKRAFGARRHSVSYPPRASKQPGFLIRTFSLSRNDRKPRRDSSGSTSPNPDADPDYEKRENVPSEQDKLHPHWRPQWDIEDSDSCECSFCQTDGRPKGDNGQFLLADNRPRGLQRSLSARMKQTFAILPTQTQWPLDHGHGTERRTIRRSPSGNLKVMRRQSSADSLRHRSASEASSQKGFWRGHSLRKRRSAQKLRRTSSLGSRLERLPILARTWSEKRREKRSQELRQMISGPRQVRDGVGEVLRIRALTD